MAELLGTYLYGLQGCGHLNNPTSGAHLPSRPRLMEAQMGWRYSLSQVISHFDLYGQFYPSQWSMVIAVITVLTGEVADWVADLHSEHARELTNVGMFLESLRGRFEDETRTLAAEGQIVTMKQRGRPAKEYIKEFKKAAGRLWAWPEQLLVHHFHLGLDRELRQVCLYRGLPPRLSKWFKAMVELDVGLRAFRPWGENRVPYQPGPVDRLPTKLPSVQTNLLVRPEGPG